MNIPGALKTNRLIQQAFAVGKKEILSALSEKTIPILESHEIHEKTGDEMILCIKADARIIKEAMSGIEDTHPIGRIFDIDVITPDGIKLSRCRCRKCLICNRQAQDCARSRRHSAEELFDRINQLLIGYFQQAGSVNGKQRKTQ
jgi:holo-ACP synthase